MRRLTVLFGLSIMGAAACSSSDPTSSGTTDERPATTAAPPTTAAPTTAAPTTAPSAAAGAATDEPTEGAEDTEEATESDDEVALAPSEPGASGEEVQLLQERLASFGFGPGAADGDYGNRTSRAVAAFQDLVGLEPTGEADRATIEALAGYDYDGLVLRAGDEGPDVERLQEQLAGGPFDPGPADGTYGTKTVEAVWALEKLAGVPVDGDWGPLDANAWDLLMNGDIGQPVFDSDVRWVEVDLSEQLVKVYDPGAITPTLVSHSSSGSGIPWENDGHRGSSITPVGDFEISRRIAGWRESSLGIGRLYNPLYFNGGIALHGSQSVPLYPASHGCIRLPMHIADYLPDALPNGTPVHVTA